MRMKTKRLALLGILTLSAALLPSCGGGGWKSDAKAIRVRDGGGYVAYEETDSYVKKADGAYYTVGIRYAEDGDSITIEKTTASWTASDYAVSASERKTEYTQTGISVGVWRYANTSWVIEYKERR